MEITKEDERNISYFARRYVRRYLSIEDLKQVGRLAVLEATTKENKYLSILSAISNAARKEEQYQRVCCESRTFTNGLHDTSKLEDKSLKHVDDMDLLEAVCNTRRLSESAVLSLTYYLLGYTKKQIAKEMNLTVRTINGKIRRTLAKLHESHNKLEGLDEDR